MKRKKPAPLTYTADCCAEWAALIGGFYWFSLEEYPEVLAMPCVLAGGNRHRVNYCPSCGKGCRSAVVARERVEASRGQE